MTPAEAEAARAPSGVDPEVIRRLPERPGIYIFKNASGKVLYVGKAVRLRSRVRSYFGKNPGRGPWIAKMVRDAASVECVLTDNELEALILESNYIKKLKPKHNMVLRDDKQYPYLKFSVQEDYPRLSIVRNPAPDGASYLGPFPAAGSVRRTVRFINKTFHIRACTGGIEDKTSKRCIYFQMGQCLGPCDGLQGGEEYRAGVKDVLDFLKGRDGDLLARLGAEMEAHAEALRFEAAAKLRDQIRAIEHVTDQQRILSLKGANQDVLGLRREGDKAFFRLLFVRGGRLLGDQGLIVPIKEEVPDAEVVSGFVKQYYQSQVQFPDEILLPAAPPDADSISQWLSGLRGKKLALLAPRRGEKRRLVEMACENAGQSLEREGAQIEKEHATLEGIRKALGLEDLPLRIEAFDISNLHGSHIVGASVTFREGRPMKDGYRRYKIRTVEGAADDFASMGEIVGRRLERLVKEGGELPDLILIDGGKGQLSAAAAALAEAGVTESAICAISKGRSAEGAADQDVIHLPGRKAPVRLPEGGAEKLLLQRIRDEVHRFALTFHRSRKARGEIRSGLDDVPGLGPKRRRALLRTFGSLRGVLEAGEAQLLEVEGVTPKLVAALRAHFSLRAEEDKTAEEDTAAEAGKTKEETAETRR